MNQPATTRDHIQCVHTHWFLASGVSFLVSIPSILRGFIDLNTSELFIIRFFFLFIFFRFKSVCFFKYAWKWVLPFVSVLSCHSGPEAGWGSATLLRVLLMCDWRWKILAQKEAHCFLFVAAAVAWRTTEVKPGGSRAKKEHRSAFSSELHQFKVQVCLCGGRHLLIKRLCYTAKTE